MTWITGGVGIVLLVGGGVVAWKVIQKNKLLNESIQFLTKQKTDLKTEVKTIGTELKTMKKERGNHKQLNDQLQGKNTTLKKQNEKLKKDASDSQKTIKLAQQIQIQKVHAKGKKKKQLRKTLEIVLGDDKEKKEAIIRGYEQEDENVDK